MSDALDVRLLTALTRAMPCHGEPEDVIDLEWAQWRYTVRMVALEYNWESAMLFGAIKHNNTKAVQ
jgi:hypothetical protein